MPLFFVTLNTRNRQSLLANQEVHEIFIAYCERGSLRGAGVGGYVLMPDHIHLFVRLSPDLSLAQWVPISSAASHETIFERAPHWQEKFFDHLLRSRDSYAQNWEYVRRNPVRAGLAASCDNWPYQGEIVRLPFD